MDLKENKDKLNSEYGEFVCTEFNWIPIEKQKETAEKLSKITESKNEKDNKNKDKKKRK